MPCAQSARRPSRIPGCDRPAQLPPVPCPFSFVALTPLHQGVPLPLGDQTSWDQTPRDHMAQWDFWCTFRLGDEHCYLITNVIECLRGGWTSPVRTLPEVPWPCRA